MSDSARTLAVDVGGTGLKAVVLSPDGEMVSERIRRETPYPCPPPVLLDELDALAKTQPEYDRVSVGFPGAIRRGRVREVPAFSRRAPGEGPDRHLVAQWTGFELKEALQARFGKPTPGGERRRRAGLRRGHRPGHGAGGHPGHRGGLGGVLRRGAAAAHGALARPFRRGPVDRGGLRRPPPREDRHQGVAQARDERAGRVRGDGAAGPPLRRRWQRQTARPRHPWGPTAPSCPTSPGCSAASSCGNARSAPRRSATSRRRRAPDRLCIPIAPPVAPPFAGRIPVADTTRPTSPRHRMDRVAQHHAAVAPRAPRRPVRGRSRARRRLTATGADLVMDYPPHHRDAVRC